MNNHTRRDADCDAATRIRRLRFRSWHRGTREMDLILGGFADQYLDQFTQEELDRYEALLEENDPDIYNWITGRETPPSRTDTALVTALSDHIDTEASKR